MADPVTFIGIEKQHLVSLGDGLLITEMPYVHAPIRKHQLLASGALLRALAPATALTLCLPDRDRLRFEERVDGELRDMLAFIFQRRAHYALCCFAKSAAVHTTTVQTTVVNEAPVSRPRMNAPSMNSVPRFQPRRLTRDSSGLGA